MGFILDMASGENLTEQPHQAVDQVRSALRESAPTALQAPYAGLITAEANVSTTRFMPLIDIEALIRSIED